MTKKQRKMLIRIIVCAVMLIALQLIPVAVIPELILYLAAYLIIGYDILKKAGKGILNKQVFDENFLMSIATVGAFVQAISTRSGDYVEGIAEKLGFIDFYWHTLSIKEKGLAYCGVSLVPPSSLKAFIDVIDDIPKLYGLKGLLEKALGQNKWVIHYGL